MTGPRIRRSPRWSASSHLVPLTTASGELAKARSDCCVRAWIEQGRLCLGATLSAKLHDRRAIRARIEAFALADVASFAPGGNVSADWRFVGVVRRKGANRTVRLDELVRVAEGLVTAEGGGAGGGISVIV